MPPYFFKISMVAGRGGGPGVRTPPELPSGVCVKRKNPVRILSYGGWGEGGRQLLMTNSPGPPLNLQTRLRCWRRRRTRHAAAYGGCHLATRNELQLFPGPDSYALLYLLLGLLLLLSSLLSLLQLRELIAKQRPSDRRQSYHVVQLSSTTWTGVV